MSLSERVFAWMVSGLYVVAIGSYVASADFSGSPSCTTLIVGKVIIPHCK
jgi:hypothetical protein